eukprot:TRINITY_DN8761_c0_g1_i1.p1 TRINITY_DN8761_c0_g1~~TRINITY_DN8761_c0_g1_i1.p1  ORF type:complete len:238 (+),score=45.33 TRINITY_DN8761_c0_g1_i1:138-851(+)
MRTVSDMYQEYKGRKTALQRALTVDSTQLHQQCDPQRENLCLYGFPDGTWEVDYPAEEVPPEFPEPALGINFCRDGLKKHEWLTLIAAYSDSWLLAMAFFKAARFSQESRQQLFDMINSEPTLYEIVTRTTGPTAVQGRIPSANRRSSGSNRRKTATTNYIDYAGFEGENEFDDGDEEEGDGESEPCPTCGKTYRSGEFWIACDYCESWYCARCSNMNEEKADAVKVWKCSQCKGED